MEMEKQNQGLKRKVAELSSIIDTKDTQFNRMEKRIKTLEGKNDMLQRTTALYEHDKRELENVVSSSVLRGKE